MTEFDNIPNKGLDEIPRETKSVPSHLYEVKQPENVQIDVKTIEKVWYHIIEVFNKASELASKGYEIVKSIQDIKTVGFIALGVLVLIIIAIILVKVL